MERDGAAQFYLSLFMGVWCSSSRKHYLSREIACLCS